MPTTSAVWPAQLPKAPRVFSYRQTSPRVVVRSQTDAGPAKVRRRTTAGSETCDIELVLTRQQVALLKQFFNVSVAGGSLEFEWKHHQTGNPIAYRFLEPPTFSPNSPRREHAQEIWIASFELETMPGTEVEDGDEGGGGDPDPMDPPAVPAGGGGGGIFGYSLGGVMIEIGLPKNKYAHLSARNWEVFTRTVPADPGGPFAPFFIFSPAFPITQTTNRLARGGPRFTTPTSGGGGGGGTTGISGPGTPTLGIGRIGTLPGSGGAGGF